MYISLPELLWVLADFLLGQLAAAVLGFFNPKVFFDFATKRLDIIVRPVPILQTVNLMLSLLIIAIEMPVQRTVGKAIKNSFKARFIAIPIIACLAMLQYQAADSAIYYLIGLSLYISSYYQGEVCLPRPFLKHVY
ncbi:PRO41 protein [Diaporthe sp. PMI_573]|nr:PRO41 protein [Diaporthaceae sp. PMI_573]